MRKTGLVYTLVSGFICFTPQFPDLKGSIEGEEDNTFRNKLGESVKVEIKESIAETSALLQTVLVGDTLAAEKLALEVHRDIQMSDVNTSFIPKDEIEIGETLGIWIDPIGKYVLLTEYFLDIFMTYLFRCIFVGTTFSSKIFEREFSLPGYNFFYH